MKLSFNNIGNYSPMASVNNKSGVGRIQTGNIRPASLNKQEKNHFAAMFPDNKSDVMEYSFYGKGGKKSDVSLGTLIDRRG